ncbi:MAG: alpha/beta hydrolase [Acidobacteriota bacterium]
MTENPTSDNTSFDPVLRVALPSLGAAGILGLLEVARSRFQHGHMFAPTRYPDGLWEASEHGLPAEDVWFESEDGTRLHGWWIPHPEARMTVLYCHGNSGNIAERTAVFTALRRLKVHLFAFDYRGYGRSEGTPSKDGVCADARAALDWVVDNRGVAHHQLVVFGHSLGGAIAIDTTAQRPEVAGLVVQASFTQVVDMARHRYPDLPVHWIAKNGFRSIEKVAELRMPKLFAHGRQDETIPFAHGEALFEAAAEPKEFLAIERAGHNDLHQWGGLRYYSRLTRFRRRAEVYGASRAAAEASPSE